MKRSDIVELQVKKLVEDAKLPEYGYKGDAGLDLYSVEDKTIVQNKISKIKTGLSMKIPEGCVAIIKDKSGLAVQGLHVTAGVIDEGYRGEWEVVITNLTEEDVEIKKGQKIAQAIILPFKNVEIKEVEELGEAERGEKGFGSTGLE